MIQVHTYSSHIRYRTLTEGITYLQRRSLKTVCEKLLIIWILGLWVTLPVTLDWEHISRDPSGQKHCVSNKIPYWVAHYSCSSFWFPALLLVSVYYKVYNEIKTRLRSRVGNHGDHAICESSTDTKESDGMQYSV